MICSIRAVVSATPDLDRERTNGEDASVAGDKNALEFSGTALDSRIAAFRAE